ncbi:GH32 C-terminal domain-containing protein [Catenovulum sp. 2E275]|uniref:GH32 C-terminal domain-containing protein n=1 Tax=Catenovulum sp. 2E275 TaxID=2980497 RepID=UPI0021D2C243|nr:GH32 C-terminal domain-containing protein [Catenovulum sp. 2E275]MCU4677254.1 GH32 C-terminal domain-containing protein [Catenovulum sp. 2E275]
MNIKNALKLGMVSFAFTSLSGCLVDGSSEINPDQFLSNQIQTDSEQEPLPEPETQQPLTQLVYLNFDENSGSATTLNQVDQSIFSISNTFSKPERVLGIEGNALRTDGFSTWATGSVNLANLSEMTVETWVALESYPSDHETVYDNLSPASFIAQRKNNQGFSLDINTFGQWQFNVSIDGVMYNLTAPDVFPLYSWNHIAAVVDGFNGTIKLYLNGVEVASTDNNPIGGKIDQADSELLIAKSYNTASSGPFSVINGLNGAFDEIKIYQGSKTADAFTANVQITDNSHPLGTSSLETPESRFINDPLRPIFHAMPPANWANEPHGLVEFNGQYHMFYQRTPNGPFKTQMHWGHMVSPDFVSWSHLPDALWPEINKSSNQGFDMKGIWSGDVVVEGDTAYAFYTNVNHSGPFNPGVAVATSKQTDLKNWVKLGPIIDKTGVDDMRDPYLWKQDGIWHMIIGAINNNRGALLHYTTSDITDLNSWQASDFMSDFSALTAPDGSDSGLAGVLWEMPVFDKISEDKYILLVNPVGNGYKPRGIYWIGRWVNDQFVPDNNQAKYLDLITGHISPTVARNDDGLLTAIGIVDERRSSEAQLAAGWTQTFSVPRVWSLAADGATVQQVPAAQLAQLRLAASLREQNNLVVNGETVINGKGRHVEIIAELDVTATANKYGVVIAASADGEEKTVIYYDAVNKNIVLDKTISSVSTDAFELTEQVAGYDEEVFGKPEKFHIFVDGSVVDVFINEKAAFSFRIYPLKTDSHNIALYSQAADTTFTKVQVYQLADMQSKRTFISSKADHNGIVEENENGEIITVRVTNNVFAQTLDLSKWQAINLPSGVSLGHLNKIDESTAEITLAGNSSDDFDTDISDITVTISAEQFANMPVPLSVTGLLPTITAEVEAVTSAQLSINGDILASINEGLEAGQVISVALTNNTFVDPLNKTDWTAQNLPAGLDFTLTRVSDNQVDIQIVGTAESYQNQDQLVTISIAPEAFIQVDPELFTQPVISTAILFKANKIFNLTLPEDGQNNALVIGRFDGAQTTLDQGWSASGDFANPATENAWKGTTISSSAAQVGEGAVSSCEMNGNAKGCDQSTGRLTSPIFTLEKENLFTLLAGGENNNKAVGIRILDTAGNLLHNYSPASCGPANIDGNDDWTVIQASVLNGANIRVQFYDEETEGCGFVSFDHLFQSDAAKDDAMLDGGTVTLTAKQRASLSYGVSLPYQDSDSNIIGSFDDALAMIADGWIATGDFANPSSAEAWHSLTTSAADSARVGAGGTTSCELNGSSCDVSTGTLTSPLFTVSAEQANLAMLISGGNVQMSNEVGVRILNAADTELLRFNPGTCSDAYIKNDLHWKTIDLSGLIGQQVKVEIFDNETGSCGFISVDHIHLTSAQAIDPNYVDFNYDAIDFSESNPDQSLNNLTVTDDAFVQVIGSFDSAIQMLNNGWQASGDFINPNDNTAWTGTTVFTDTAKVGLNAVSTCEINYNANGCDQPVGTITSPNFKIKSDRPYLNFLMSGGNGNVPVGLKVINPISGAVIEQYLPNSCSDSRTLGNQHWVSINLSDWIGQFVQVQIFDEESGACGFVSFDHVHMSASLF